MSGKLPAAEPSAKAFRRRHKLGLALSDEEIERAALSDPDALPTTPGQLARMHRIPLAKHARWRSGFSQSRFAEVYGIAVGTLRDWEQGRSEPDQTARAYLQVIAADPEGTKRALARAKGERATA